MADSQRKSANLFDEVYPDAEANVRYRAVYVGNGDFTLSSNCPFIQNTYAILFFLAGNVSSGANSSTNGVYEGQNRTVTAIDGYVTIAYRIAAEQSPESYQSMLNTGSTAKPYEPYGWLHSLRKLTTATEAVENPLYSDGTAITAYTLKGNTVQNGTPTPSVPIAVQGVGELDSGQYKIPIPSGGVTTIIYLTEQLMKIGDTVDSLISTGTVTYNIKKFVLTGEENISVSNNPKRFSVQLSGAKSFDVRAYPLICTHYPTIDDGRALADVPDLSIFAGAGYAYMVDSRYSTVDDYKAYLAGQYAAGTPVTVYYILATAQTETITAPSIPTTEGANSITVDTTVQPSEFTATWTGWHNAEVKEKSENLLSPDMTFNASCGYVNDANCFPYSFGGNRHTAFFYCKPSTKYTFSAVNPDRLFIYEYNETKTAEELAEYTPENPLAADRLIAWQNPIADNPASFETSATAKMVSIYYSLNNVATDVMTNEGQTAKPYEPYWK